MKYFSISSVLSKSAITPSFIGLIATMSPGVRPSMSLASRPTAYTFLVFLSIATIEGSLTTIPRPLAKTRVFAVPRSMARSLEKGLNRFLSLIIYVRFSNRENRRGGPLITDCFCASRCCESHVVLVALFGFVHSRIGKFDKLFRFSTVLWKTRNTEARRQKDVCSHAAFEPMTCYPQTNSLGHLKSAFCRSLGQHQY